MLRVLNMIKQTVFTRTSFMDPEPDFPNPDFFPVRTQEKSPILIQTKGPEYETLAEILEHHEANLDSAASLTARSKKISSNLVNDHRILK